MSQFQAFLLLEEHKVNHEKLRSLPSSVCKDAPPSITMKSVNASWANVNGGPRPTLEDINVDFKGNRLIMVIGTVGAGKVSLTCRKRTYFAAF